VSTLITLYCLNEVREGTFEEGEQLGWDDHSHTTLSSFNSAVKFTRCRKFLVVFLHLLLLHCYRQDDPNKAFCENTHTCYVNSFLTNSTNSMKQSPSR
jgi:hypothetical protein